MAKKRKIIDLESMKWHVLMWLYRNDAPILPGAIKGQMLGVPVEYDEVYDSLWNLGRVVQVQKGIQLTDEGRNYIEQELKQERQRILHWLSEDEFEMAVMDFLFHRPHLVKLDDFPEMLVKKAPQYGNTVGYGSLIQALHQMDAYIEKPEMQWYTLSELGRDMYEMKKGKTSASRTQARASVDNSFTAEEKIQMNAKLDEILAKLERTSLENEAIWTDMKADFEELRDLFELSKKTWRQLLIGKLTEWVAGGIVSETLSKQIVEEVIKPITQDLLG